MNRIRNGLPAAGLVALTLLAYLPALHCGFIWDDDLHVLDNATLRTVGGLYDIWFGLFRHTTCQYYPATFSVFWLEYRLWGLNPAGYHAVNILLHALNATLLARLLRRLGFAHAWFAAAVFAVHPVNVMSVAWITELKNVLAGSLMLGTLLIYLRLRPDLCPSSAAPPRPLRHDLPAYAALLALFLVALMAKTAAAVLILAILLILVWRKPALAWRDVLPLLPLLLLAVGFAGLTVLVEQGAVWGTDLRPDWSPLERLLIAGRAFWLYVQHLVWPVNLAFLYPRWTVTTAPLAWLPLGAFAALLFALWHFRARWGRAPAAALLYVFCAAPALVLLQTMYMMRYTLVSDHWFYFAAPAAIALLVAAAARGLPRGARKASRVVGAAVLAILVMLVWIQLPMYRNLESLWRITLQRNPQAWLAANNLGTMRAAAGNHQAALDHYNQALRAEPGFPDISSNIGVSLQALGRNAESVPWFEQALHLNPEHVQSLNNLAAMRLAAGHSAEALALIERALRLKPDLPGGRTLEARALTALKRYPEAVEAYRAAVALAPKDAATRNDLGNAYHRAGRDADALAEYAAAIQLKPDAPEPRNNLAAALIALGRHAEAIAPLEQALALRPDYPEAAANLARARAAGD